jgi:hypothetical protein
LSSTVVMVAVDTCDSVAIASADSDIWKGCSDGRKRPAHVAGQRRCVKGCAKKLRSSKFIAGMPINLLKLLHHFARSEFRFGPKHASLMADAVCLIQWPNP